MNNTIRRILSQVNFNRILIALFLIIYVGLYYTEYQKYITLSYGVLLLGFVYNWVKCRRIKYSSFLMMAGAFFLYSFLSVVWAPVLSSSQGVIGQLLKSSLISCIFINLINDEDDIRFAFFFLSLGALIYAILYLSFVDISQLGDSRIATDENASNLPNVNIVGLIVAFSFVYFLFAYFKKGSLFFLLAGLVGFVIIFMLGARKTIISLLICLVMLFVKLPKKSKIAIGFIVLAFIGCMLLVVPAEYLEFVFGRFSDVTSNSTIGADDNMRIDLILKGIDFSLQSPIFGHGFYSYSYLYGVETSAVVYSHNNFIETLVGGGVAAFALYYGVYYKIATNILSRNIEFNYGYLLLMLLVVLLFNHLFIVVLLDRFTWLLLALIWAGSCHYKRHAF